MNKFETTPENSNTLLEEAPITEFNRVEVEIRDRNLERKTRNCLHCGRAFITPITVRICGQCHKIVDRL